MKVHLWHIWKQMLEISGRKLSDANTSKGFPRFGGMASFLEVVRKRLVNQERTRDGSEEK